ncbi:hypothetical protein X943_003950 [Babesia divergens]|uniref:Uncharacterized protein n=1 Tax=Babesia divergens TaxID=32595 RepID=A0AAD9LKB6_BABDI|nr:hypothetical protein X943_003950 [Babesia divergens]
MRSTWHNLRRAVNQSDTFKQLLRMDSDEDSGAAAGFQPDMKSQWSEESRREVDRMDVTGATQTSLESSEQRMRMIRSIGEVTPGDNADVLGDFTTQLISQYEGGLRPSMDSFSKSSSRASSVSNRFYRPGSSNDIDSSQFMEPPADNVDTGSSVATSSRLYILFKMCCALETLWADIESRVSEATGCSMYIEPLPRPPAWQECKSVHNDHTETILSWLERSFHTMGLIAHILGIGDARVLTSSAILRECLNTAVSSGHGTFGSEQEAVEETAGEYMRLIKFIAKLQVDYDRRLHKLQVTQDSALLKATKTTDLEKNERIKTLERELEEKSTQIRELTGSLQNANTVNTQLVQKNEQLIASNQRLLMTKSEFIDKDTVSKTIQQYYDQDRTGGQHREDILKLLESMLGIEPPPQVEQKPAQTDALSLANQFIEFLDDEAQ